MNRRSFQAFDSGFRYFGRSALYRTLIIAFLIRAGDYSPIFAQPLHQIFMSAIWTLFGNGLCCRRELAFRIVSATVKRIAFASPLFDELSVFAFRALHTDEVLLHI